MNVDTSKLTEHGITVRNDKILETILIFYEFFA